MSDVLAARISEPDLVDLPDWRVAQILNALDPALGAFTGAIVVADARQILMTSLTPDNKLQVWAALQRTAHNFSHPLNGVAIAAVGVIDKLTVVDMADPKTGAMVTGMLEHLVAGELLAAETRDTILALAQKEQSWAEAHGVTVTEDIIFTARGRPRVVGGEH